MMQRFAFRFRGRKQEIRYPGRLRTAETDEAQFILHAFAEKLNDIWSDFSVELYLLILVAKLKNEKPERLQKQVLFS